MSNTNVQVSRDEKSWEAEIKAEISSDSLQHHYNEVLKELQKTAKVDGFRPGKAPIESLKGMYSQDMLLQQAAEHAIQAELPEILAKENVLIVETPRVTTDTPVLGKPLTFTARAGLAPSIELGDYSKIGKKHQMAKEEITVSDTEHNDAMMHIRRERARIDKVEAGTDAQKAAEESKSMDEKDLPALDDEFAQSIGYDDSAKFFETLRTNIKTEKEMQAAQKRRSMILDEIIKESKISYPVSLLNYELDDMESRLSDDLSRMSVTLEKYLVDTKKTREDLRREWHDGADTRAKVRLLLAHIAHKENLEPEVAMIDHELEHAREHYPQADVHALRSHITHAMRNEMALRYLEGNTEPVGHTGHDHE